MIKLKKILFEIYTEPTFSKMTSIIGDVSYPVKWLFKKGAFKGTVIDYGCGRIARNTVFLRDNGLKVYSYDPYWGENGVDGYVGITKDLLNESFDVGFTSFVLNVINIVEENETLQWMNSHCRNEYHITRNQDVTKMIKNALSRGDKTVTNFFTKVFQGNINEPITDKDVENFSYFGTKTSKGFQRIPVLELKGYNLIKTNPQYKIYKRE